MNPDFRDMLFALSEQGAEFLLVGAYALAAHGYPRATGDIDILTSISGVDFDDAWAGRKEVEIEGQTFAVIGRAHLLQNKKASGRPRDLADVAWLEGEEAD